MKECVRKKQAHPVNSSILQASPTTFSIIPGRTLTFWPPNICCLTPPYRKDLSGDLSGEARQSEDGSFGEAGRPTKTNQTNKTIQANKTDLQAYRSTFDPAPIPYTLLPYTF